MFKTILVTLTFVLGFFLGFSATKYYMVKRNQKKEVLSAVFDISPTAANTPTPTNLPTPTPTPSSPPSPSPSLTPTLTPIPQPLFTSEQIHSFIERFAGQYGVDPNILRHIAVCESGFNQNAINGSYAGLFQFGTSAWKNNRTIMGEDNSPDLRLNAEEATQTSAYLISIGKGHLWPNCIP